MLMTAEAVVFVCVCVRGWGKETEQVTRPHPHSHPPPRLQQGRSLSILKAYAFDIKCNIVAYTQPRHTHHTHTTHSKGKVPRRGSGEKVAGFRSYAKQLPRKVHAKKCRNALPELALGNYKKFDERALGNYKKKVQGM